MTPEILKMTTRIVTAYASGNDIPADALPALIRSVHGALSSAASPSDPVQEKPVPAVPPRKSVQPDYIICLEDGRKLKLLSRHLKKAYNMTPEQYRQRWGLPSTYPMVAPNYAARRSAIAKQAGLGRSSGGNA